MHWQSTCDSAPNTCQIPMKSLLPCFQSFSGNLIWNTSPLLLGEVSVLFVSRLTPNGKYLVQDCGNMLLSIQMQLSQKQKSFSNFLFHFWNLHQILHILKNGMIVVANVFPNLETVKVLLRPLSKNRHLRTHFDSQHVKVSKILAKSPREGFFMFFHYFVGRWLGKCCAYC